MEIGFSFIWICYQDLCQIYAVHWNDWHANKNMLIKSYIDRQNIDGQIRTDHKMYCINNFVSHSYDFIHPYIATLGMNDFHQ